MSPTTALRTRPVLEARLQEHLEALFSAPAGPCLSLYLPTRPAGAGGEPARIRLKNLLRLAEERLAAFGGDAAEEILAPVRPLTAEAELDFWRHQEEALALYLAPGFARYVRLPFPAAERLEVRDRFVLRPILPLLGNGTFYVLALSQNEVRLLQARGPDVRRVDLEGVPRSLVEALGEQLTTQILQYHTASPAGAGARPAIFHGRGTGEEDAKAELARYFQRVDAGIAERLRGRSVPLVLAGVEYLLPIYRAASGYPALAPEGIPGNPEHLSDRELAQRARPLAEPLFEYRKAAARFAALAGNGKTSHHVNEILPAARQGRVAVLFLSTAAELRGSLDEEGGLFPGDDDLLDLAAAWTVAQGGKVHAMPPGEVPDGGELAAIFRYRGLE